jgi:pimeloyl-ACP methyl ester carboxylesterase
VRCPLLLVQGTDDQYGTMAQLDVIERAAGGPVERVHPAARHAPHLEAPEATLEAVARFLLAHAAARRAVPEYPEAPR